MCLWNYNLSLSSTLSIRFVQRYFILFSVIQTKCIENYSSKDKEDISNYPRRTIPLPNVPLHVSVNCDCTILAVVLEKDNCPTVVFYDVLSFYKQNVAVIKEIRLSATPGTLISEVGWNPALPGVFTACKKDGSLGVYEIKDNIIDVNEIPPAAGSCCFCWSPKGKRIAVGSRNGKITQYKPDLKPVAMIDPPPLIGAHSLISLQWVASYQFVGIYQSIEEADQTKLIVVDAPKTGENVYTNYEDICYSGSIRKSYFYMIFQQHWNILMVASSNSTELGVLGMREENNWLQWILPDTARAELPLTANYQDAFPVGASFDTSPNRPLPWGEDTIPPCPYLVLLSHTGVMCIFDVVNLKQGAPTVCSPPENIVDASGLSLFTTSQPTVIEVNLGVAADTSATPTKPSMPAAAVVPQQSLPTYKPPNNTFSFAQQPQTPKAALTPTSVAAGQSTAAPAVPPTASPFCFQVQPSSEQPLFGGQLSSSSLTFGPAATTGDVAQQKCTKNQTTEKSSLKDATSDLLEKMIKEECASLEVQFKAVLAQGRSGARIDIGDGEKSQLVKQLEEPMKFIEEIVEVCLAQNAEVHSLQHDSIFSWALYEDTLSRYNSKDDTFIMETQPLDPVAERRQAETKKTLYYIESQLSQANKALDENWDRFQDYAKRTHRAQQMPTMEAIFQTMVRQNAILQKQMYLLKDIRSHVKRKSTALDESYLLLSLDNPTPLSNEMQKLSIGTEAIHRNYYEKTMHRTERFTEQKNYKLRDILKIRSVTHVSSVQPQLLSVLDTTRSKLKSVLSTPMSPLPKPSQGENDQLFQSTPIKKEQSPPKPLSLQSPTKQSNTRSTAAAFQPLSNAIPSAFASTVQPQSKLLNFQSHPIPVSKPLFADSGNSTFIFGTSLTANADKTSTVTASNSSNSKIPAVKPLTKSFDSNTEPSSTVSLATTPVASSAFSTSNPQKFEISITVQSKTFPDMSVANTKATVASGITAFSATPQFTLNFGSSTPTSTTSTMIPKTTAASTTSTAAATPIFPKIIVSATPPLTTSLVTAVGSDVPSSVSSSTAQAISEGSSIASQPSKPATTRPASIFSTAESTTLFGNSSALFSVSGAVTTTTSSTGLSSSTATVAATPAFNTTTAATSIFGQAMPVSKNLSTTTTSSKPDFGIQTSTTASATQSFGISPSLGSIFTASPSATTRASIFGSTATSTASTSAFGSTKSGVSIFGSNVASSSSSSTGLVSCAGTTSTIFSFPVSTTSSDSIFGSGNTSISSAGSTFKAPSSSTSSGTLFGASTTQTGSVFGNVTVASTSPSAAPVFGSTVSTTSGSGSIFQSGAASIFGSGTTSGSTTFGSVTTSAVSMFGVKPTTTMSIFDSVPASTMPSVFGGTSPPASTTSSVFGSTSTPSARTTSSVFGGGSPAFGQTASIFGSTPNTQSGGSNFATTSPSQGGSIFSFKTGGDAPTSFFGAGNISDSTKSIFGSHTPAASAGGSVFGTATAAATSPFGAEPVFGGATPAGTTSPFGQGMVYIE
nr:unnamed protein product [Callosobruchus chinensis]